MRDLHEPYRCVQRNGRTKNSYRSKARAKRAIRQLRHGHVQLYVYQCPICGYWHTTSQPPRND